MAASQINRQAQGGKRVANLVAQQQMQQQLLKQQQQQQQAIQQAYQQQQQKQVTAVKVGTAVKVSTATFAQVIHPRFCHIIYNSAKFTRYVENYFQILQVVLE